MEQTHHRQPLDIARIRETLVPNEFPEIKYYESTGSTNSDLMQAARQGAAAWTVALAEQQTAGRGRMGRSYSSPYCGQLTLSIIVRPTKSQLDHLGTLNLATGIGILDALGWDQGVKIKWPNDLIVANRKLCGMLAEAASLDKDPAVVIGFGLNTGLTREELPVAHATSLELEGIPFERTQLAIDVLRCVKKRLVQWQAQDMNFMEDFRTNCVTIGQDVRVLLPGGSQVDGIASAVLNDGRIVVREPDEYVGFQQATEHIFAVGDVEHLRLQGGTHWYSNT